MKPEAKKKMNETFNERYMRTASLLTESTPSSSEDGSPL